MLSILVVDDQELNRSLLRVMLEKLDYQVFTATDGVECLAALEQHPIDIVLLDVIMPVMDGFETAELIKKRYNEVYLPIIFITALEDEQSFERCLEVGGDDFIHKPFQEFILKAKIKAHSRTRKLSQEAHQQNLQLAYHQNQIEREHEIVEHIFNNALDHQHQFTSHVAFHLSPASMFNGDMFLTAQSPMGSLYCLLGDFTGHGLAAAVGALPASRVFYTMVNKGMAVSDIAVELNSILAELLPEHMFCAASIIELSASGKSISAWLGGLPDTYVIDDQGELITTLESQHMALGILEQHEFDRALIHLEVDATHRLVLATDGIIETSNNHDEYFGEERLIATLASKPKITCQDIVKTVHDFAKGSKQQDDLSLVLLNCLPLQAPEQVKDDYSSLPFCFSLSLNAKQIKETDPVLEIVDVISRVSGLNAHRANLFLLVSEAYNNAVDHGVLGLDSKIKNEPDGFFKFYQLREEAIAKLTDALVIIELRYCPINLELHLSLCDSGNGFSKLSEQGEQPFQEHGRGLSLLDEVAETVVYNQVGNQVEICYKLAVADELKP